MDEIGREHLRQVLVEQLGEQAAETLMSQLPPYRWPDLATKADIAELRGELAQLRGEFVQLRGEFGELRGEFGELRGSVAEQRGEFGELRGSVAEQRGELIERIGAVHESVGALHVVVARQTWVMTLGIVAAIAASVGITATLV
ncbi:hypothetical protein ER308_15300 [Egibacter rhizosphaerae]|uniref:DUF1640 domain-containing protein n=1 Tax=Egibacter rhizosphaerae TaxID=1670831 RepID=A0A411YHV2_9ACTN|nr:hypothetical protein [Egibacter rhizosphaerae]QBI20797.1 hypothetical protein ER308_15300 [Egibacter rhizosphaerae]